MIFFCSILHIFMHWYSFIPLSTQIGAHFEFHIYRMSIQSKDEEKLREPPIQTRKSICLVVNIISTKNCHRNCVAWDNTCFSSRISRISLIFSYLLARKTNNNQYIKLLRKESKRIINVDIFLPLISSFLMSIS